MAFLSNNPISAPKSEITPPVPEKGTRGIFPMSDGWYDIDDEGNIQKLGGGTGDVDLSGKEDKDNKVKQIDMNIAHDPETEEYPNTFAVADAIIQEKLKLEKLIEQNKGFCITGRGEPTDDTAGDVGLLYYDEESSPPTVYICYAVEDGRCLWVRVDELGREANELAYTLAFDMYGEDGSIAQDYQKKSDKVTSISSSSTDEQYPSAKAVNDRVVAKADWEQIEAKTLEENVTEIVLNLPRSYKQLFWVFKVPTINPDKTSGFAKGRMVLYSNGNQTIAFDQDYGMTDVGNEWYLCYHMQMLGEHCSVFKGFKDKAAHITSDAYIHLAAYDMSSLGWQPGKDIGSKGMYYLKLTMMCQTSGARYFPTGTKYELWGVRA